MLKVKKRAPVQLELGIPEHLQTPTQLWLSFGIHKGLLWTDRPVRDKESAFKYPIEYYYLGDDNVFGTLDPYFRGTVDMSMHLGSIFVRHCKEVGGLKKVLEQAEGKIGPYQGPAIPENNNPLREYLEKCKGAIKQLNSGGLSTKGAAGKLYNALAGNGRPAVGTPKQEEDSGPSLAHLPLTPANRRPKLRLKLKLRGKNG